MMHSIKVTALVVSALLVIVCEGSEAQDSANARNQSSKPVPNISIQSRLEAIEISIEEMRSEFKNDMSSIKAALNATMHGQDALNGEILKGVHDIKEEISGKTIRFPKPVYGTDRGKKYIQGHVEILHDDVWGTLCDDCFDQNNNGANVLCKMDGYRSGIYSTSFRQPSVTKVSKIWLDNVCCSGREIDIDRCPHNPWGTHDCQHSEDVAVRCYY